MRLFGKIKRILHADVFVSKYKAENEHRNQRGIALIAMAAFLVMSVLNIKQHSPAMFVTTSVSALFLLVGYILSRYRNQSAFLRTIFYIIFILIFTSYTIMGGNEGFAALWLVVATYAVMVGIDFKAGFAISLYYLVMLLLVFVGPLSGLLQYEYNKTFLLRFPFLYAINFAFATYIVIRIRTYQYELLLKQQELEHLGTVDLSTGLMNRNHFIQCEKVFQYHHLKTLSAVFIDVNGLHEINNRKGHDVGDQMLCCVADLCKKCFKEDAIYRMGGDEFLVICENKEGAEVARLAQQLYDEIEREKYSISYGIETQDSAFDLDALVKNADTKMIQFKREYYERMNRTNR